MSLYLSPPARVIAQAHGALPDAFRRARATEWADANQGGKHIDSFLEGPVFDSQGRLYVVDIPYGRIFRIDRDGAWTLIVEYDGWPNGLAVHPDGAILICDYRNGLLRLDPETGVIQPLLARRYSESFKGLNDLCIAADGTIYFTDQGQTGMHDASGRVYRLAPNGKLDCLVDTVPSPNGIALTRDGSALFVAATRANAVWRIPLMADGGVAKVGVFCHLFGPGGPDGLLVDEDDNLLVAHVGLGHIFVFSPRGELTHLVEGPAGMHTTNLTLGPAPGNPKAGALYITESQSGTVLVTPWPAPRQGQHRNSDAFAVVLPN
jgi:gluconolactonase